MRESEFVLEMRAEGAVRARRENLLVVLQERWPEPVPADLAGEIGAMTDVGQFHHWLRAALRSSSYDEFRSAVHS